MIQNNIQAVIDNGLELTNESYEEIRINNRKIPTFEYVQNNYPELIEKFIIIEPVFKPHNQIQAETRVAKILCVLKDKNLEFSYAYDFTTSELSDFAGKTNEIVLSYRMDENYWLAAPRNY